MFLAVAAAQTTAGTFTTLMDHVAQGFEALGAAILVVGVVWSFVLAAVAVRRHGWSPRAYLVLRQAFGGTLLLGLEILVAADLVHTVAVSPTLDNVLVLGLIVLIRTFLSFSLETEIEGVAPWRRAAMSGMGTIRRASIRASEPEPALTPDSSTSGGPAARMPLSRCHRPHRLGDRALLEPDLAVASPPTSLELERFVTHEPGSAPSRRVHCRVQLCARHSSP